MASRHQKNNEWKEAKKRCRLNEEEIQMAKELGIEPRSLIKNIPSPHQRWKLPVKHWIRELHFKKFGRRRSYAESTRSTPVHPEGDERPDSAAVQAKPAPADPNKDIDTPF
jgi:hypothetical protein